MDYSKKDGGTRMLDQMKVRTLATGIGSSHTAIREHGSARAQKVMQGIKPGQVGVSEAFRPHLKNRDACCEPMEQPISDGSTAVAGHWPLISGAKSHKAAGELNLGKLDLKNDQGEQDRVPTTGRGNPITQGGLRRSGV